MHLINARSKEHIYMMCS